MGSDAAGPTSTEVTADGALVEAAIAGDRRAFESLVDRYERSALATCLAILRDHQLAEDMAQEAFIAAYRGLRTLRDPSTFGGWLLCIARNGALRSARQRTRRMQIVQAAQATGRKPASGDADDDSLLAALAKLPDNERVVIALRFVDGHSVADIATITGRPIGTVSKQLQRALARLRAELKERP